ncbi:hypothetical protein C8R47DRAFT_1213563 [Mycena vitilis]|nr:hypothetical protein C8R47DRAFT_1213563 [Mycena vitilis]
MDNSSFQSSALSSITLTVPAPLSDMEQRQLPCIITTGILDAEAWTEQLAFLESSASVASKRTVLYTMSAIRLFETSLISAAHFTVIREFLAFLEEHDLEEDAMSTDGSGDECDFEEDAMSTDDSGDECENNGDESGLVSVPPHSKAGSCHMILDDLPPEISLKIIEDLPFSDRSRFSRSSQHSADLVGYTTEASATRHLERFHLCFREVRLMLTAMGTVVTGSILTALAAPLRAFHPNNLDFVAPVGHGSAVVDFLGLGAHYRPGGQESHYCNHAFIARLWTLTCGDLKINVIEGKTWNPLDVILSSQLSCIYGYLGANGVWHAYPDLTTEGIALTSPSKFPLRHGAAHGSSIRTLAHKYMARGLTVALNELPRDHVCGVDKDCPATLRTSDDNGCAFVPFPRWSFSAEAESVIPACWSFGGSGCPQGILARYGGNVHRMSMAEDWNWYRVMRAHVNGQSSFGAV